MILVPDRRRRIIPEVVLVRRRVIEVLGIWRGEGLGKGLGQGGSVYKQPETEGNGSCHSYSGRPKYIPCPKYIPSRYFRIKKII